jgi:hypothetical protein
MNLVNVDENWFPWHLTETSVMSSSIVGPDQLRTAFVEVGLDHD